MSLAIVYSRASYGICAPLVTVEVHLARGMAGLNIVGLPETAVRESKDRVRSALVNTLFDFPVNRITINLAPADLPKEGARFDLPIALGILAASKQIPQDALKAYEFVGELALTGELRPVKGILPVVLEANRQGRAVIVPRQNANEAALFSKATVYVADHLLEVCAHLQNKSPLSRCIITHQHQKREERLDLADVKGQPFAKRALEIAAAGRHSLLFVGPPGTGKTMLASRLPGILPPIGEEEALEVAAINSVSRDGFNAASFKHIPFRAPHHTSSSIALVGGGRPPKPGEISLAHHGVLFLDELPEFNRHTLECLREPLESGHVTISRASYQTVFPAKFQLLAAMNPCPCGYAGSQDQECQCQPEQIKRYRHKISGPLLDRLDMHVTVGKVPPELLTDKSTVLESSGEVVLRVLQARHKQVSRQGKVNAQLMAREVEQYCVLEAAAEALVYQALTTYHLSARVYHRIVKLARTIADLDGSESILVQHVSEALQYRTLDRESKCAII